MKITDHLNIEKHVAGKKVTLHDQDGNDSGEWIQIASIQTRQASIALSKFQRARLEALADANESDADVLIYDAYTRYISSLVMAWSFDEECTEDHAFAALGNAPKLRNQLDMKIHDSEFFTTDSEG